MSRYLENLLALASVAEQRPLTATEVATLRTQLRALESNRRQVAGLLASLADARKEVELIAGLIAPLIGHTEQQIAALVRSERRASSRNRPENARNGA